MSDEVSVISASGVLANTQPPFVQNGSDAVMIPNYGTVNLNVQQQTASMPYFGGGIYIPKKVDREYYNIFVLSGEEFDKPYFKVPRGRSLNECMSKETRALFEALTPDMRERVKTLPSLFMAENRPYGKADDDQRVIYGFVSDIKIYENDVKIYYCGYKLDIEQQRINDLLEELQLTGNNKFNEMNRTHWAIKRCDLIQELLEARVQIPVFKMG